MDVWTRRYEDAVRSNEHALTALSRASLTKSFDADRYHTFFPDVNSKMAWLHALEAQMGVDHLWHARSSTSILALGTNGGLTDAYFASRHNHSVTAVDMPWVYLQVDDAPMREAIRAFHCSATLRGAGRVHFSPSALHPMPAAVAERCYDATTFGPSAHSFIQKAGEHGPALLREAARHARRYVIVFQEISNVAPTNAPGSGGTTRRINRDSSAHGRCSPRDNERYRVCEEHYALWRARPDSERKLPGPFTKAHCNLAPNCMGNEQWQAYLQRHTPGFQIARHGRVNAPRTHGTGARRVVTGWIEGRYDERMHWYVLERVGQGAGGPCSSGTAAAAARRLDEGAEMPRARAGASATRRRSQTVNRGDRHGDRRLSNAEAAAQLSASLSRRLPEIARSNTTLRNYMFPPSAAASRLRGAVGVSPPRDETLRWQVYSQGCVPTGRAPYTVASRPNGEASVTAQAARCLFTLTRASKHLAIIALARAQRVTHIIEEGVLGGLSLYVYGLHGFNVTGIEKSLSPDVAASLRTKLPHATIHLGNGAQILPRLARAMGERGHRVAVIFDGETRYAAFITFEKEAVYDNVAFAVFANSTGELKGERHWSSDSRGDFRAFLKVREMAAWHSDDPAYRASYDVQKDRAQSRPPHLVHASRGMKLSRRAVAELENAYQQMLASECSIVPAGKWQRGGGMAGFGSSA